MTFRKHVRLNDGSDVLVIVPKKQIRRMQTTCFRGTELARAGNFFAYHDIGELMRDRTLFTALVEDIEENYEEHGIVVGAQYSCEVEMSRLVGWSSTDSAINYPLDALEIFRPNKRSEALRVKSDHAHYKAPKTVLITTIYTIAIDERGDNDFIVFVHSIYPGKDIGELKGDVSGRENVVFFDWNHPGDEDAPVTFGGRSAYSARA